MNLFVYGSLRKACDPQRHRRLLQHARYISDGYIFARLYAVADYPGAVLCANTNERVYGEIYRIDGAEARLAALDTYEGCSNKFARPHELVRRKLEIQRDDAAPLSAWVYLYNRDPAALHVIVGGDYCSYLESCR